ncbi:MAG: tRNA lysidine(34) synthetase TilS [Chloroflexi bacterium]|nr:tRNA lysidine(34) synthetase TilS [Chloroflexota bacterium]
MESSPSWQKPATLRLGQLVLTVVRRNDSKLADGPMVLAVSGGTDSLAMLLATATIRESLGREIVVAHFSHGLRKSAEKREAALVRRIARELELPLEHEQASTGRSEASARNARYAFFGRVASSRGAALVATAHTLNDQAETLLLRLSRGTGLRGAGAMRELSHRRVNQANGEQLGLLRPILGATRADTEEVCAEWELTPASDGTNRSVRYARNRVRRRVLPELAEINPNAAGALAAFAATAQEDDDLLAQLAAEAVAGEELREPTRTTWPVHVLRVLPPSLVARVLQSAWAVLRGDGAALSRAQIESISRLLTRGSGAVDLGIGATFAVEHDTASVSTTAIASVAFAATPLALPGETIVEGWAITTSAGLADGTISNDAWRATLDLDALGDGPCVRCRIRGDRFQPLGMNQEVRLQDVLVNAKVPRSQRDNVPLVVAGERIAWVAGVRIADWAKVTLGTTRSVVIEVRPAS